MTAPSAALVDSEAQQAGLCRLEIGGIEVSLRKQSLRQEPPNDPGVRAPHPTPQGSGQPVAEVSNAAPLGSERFYAVMMSSSSDNAPAVLANQEDMHAAGGGQPMVSNAGAMVCELPPLLRRTQRQEQATDKEWELMFDFNNLRRRLVLDYGGVASGFRAMDKEQQGAVTLGDFHAYILQANLCEADTAGALRVVHLFDFIDRDGDELITPSDCTACLDAITASSGFAEARAAQQPWLPWTLQDAGACSTKPVQTSTALAAAIRAPSATHLAAVTDWGAWSRWPQPSRQSSERRCGEQHLVTDGNDRRSVRDYIAKGWPPPLDPLRASAQHEDVQPAAPLAVACPSSPAALKVVRFADPAAPP